jgi:hypothetical protein
MVPDESRSPPQGLYFMLALSVPPEVVCTAVEPAFALAQTPWSPSTLKALEVVVLSVAVNRVTRLRMS